MTRRLIKREAEPNPLRMWQLRNADLKQCLVGLPLFSVGVILDQTPCCNTTATTAIRQRPDKRQPHTPFQLPRY